MKKTKNTFRESYAAPEMEVCSVKAEAGYQTSLGSGEINDAKFEDWGTL